MRDPEDEGFAQRWSRLKREAREGKAPQDAPAPDLPQTVDEAGAPTDEGALSDKREEKREEKPFDPADLPPVDSLKSDSDYSLFMRKEVPEDLRQKALRRLWATDPVLSAPDVFDMHNIDYNAVPTFPEGVKTLYRIGQGMLSELEADAEKKAAAEAAEADSPTRESSEQRLTAEESTAGETKEQPQDAAAQHDVMSKNSDLSRNKS